MLRDTIHAAWLSAVVANYLIRKMEGGQEALKNLELQIEGIPLPQTTQNRRIVSNLNLAMWSFDSSEEDKEKPPKETSKPLLTDRTRIPRHRQVCGHWLRRDGTSKTKEVSEDEERHRNVYNKTYPDASRRD